MASLSEFNMRALASRPWPSPRIPFQPTLPTIPETSRFNGGRRLPGAPSGVRQPGRPAAVDRPRDASAFRKILIVLGPRMADCIDWIDIARRETAACGLELVVVGDGHRAVGVEELRSLEGLDRFTPAIVVCHGGWEKDGDGIARHVLELGAEGSIGTVELAVQLRFLGIRTLRFPVCHVERAVGAFATHPLLMGRPADYQLVGERVGLLELQNEEDHDTIRAWCASKKANRMPSNLRHHLQQFATSVQAIRLVRPNALFTARGIVHHRPELSSPGSARLPESLRRLVSRAAWPQLPIEVERRMREKIFLQRVARGDLDGVKALLSPAMAPIDLEACIGGARALHIALAQGHVNMAGFLLKRGADINAPDSSGRTPLCCACATGALMVVKMLLDSDGIKVNLRDDAGTTTLMTAVQTSSSLVVRQLLKHPEIEVNQRDRDLNSTALHLAAWHGRSDVVEALLEHSSVEVNALNAGGRTPLMHAVQQGQKEVVKRLLAARSVAVNLAERIGGWTALHFAVAGGREGIVRELLGHPQTKVNLREAVTGRTPLLLAIEHGHFAIMQRLLATLRVDIDLTDRAGVSAFALLRAKRRHDLVPKLLGAQALMARTSSAEAGPR